MRERQRDKEKGREGHTARKIGRERQRDRVRHTRAHKHTTNDDTPCTPHTIITMH